MGRRQSPYVQNYVEFFCEVYESTERTRIVTREDLSYLSGGKFSYGVFGHARRVLAEDHRIVVSTVWGLGYQIAIGEGIEVEVRKDIRLMYKRADSARLKAQIAVEPRNMKHIQDNKEFSRRMIAAYDAVMLVIDSVIEESGQRIEELKREADTNG